MDLNQLRMGLITRTTELNAVNTTNMKAVVGVRMVVATGFVVGGAFVHAVWAEHNVFAKDMMDSWLLFLAALLGIGTGQYAIKRTTDQNLVATKAQVKVAEANAKIAQAQAAPVADNGTPRVRMSQSIQAIPEEGEVTP